MMNSKRLIETTRRSLLFRTISESKLRKILATFHQKKVEKGEYLFRADERSRMMYVVAEGKLRVEKLLPEGQIMKIASLAPGDIVGEVALLTGERHSGQVRALTDAHVIAISKTDLQPLMRRYPQLLQNLTRIEAMRLRSNIVRKQQGTADLGLVLHLYATTDSDYLATQSATTAAISAQKIPGLVVLGGEIFRGLPSPETLRKTISRALVKNSSAYLAIRIGDRTPDIRHALLRMADRLVVTLSENIDAVNLVKNQLKAVPRARRLTPLVYTVHHAASDNLLVSTIQEQLGLTVKSRFKLARDFWQTNDTRLLEIQCQTFARLATSSSQGIAFGGGGARALSEIGIISELERQKIQFDHVAGTSMGALIAAFYAQGLTSREMSDRFREFLPTDKGLLRYNLPFIAFFRDKSVNRILRRLFGKMRIEDLPKPLTVIAADLISGQEVRLQKGLIWRAVRASMSLPVIFAPVKYHNYYLVDGGAINNVPGNVLRDQGVGRILGINCTPLEDDAIKEYLQSTNLFQLLKPGDKFWRNLRRFFKLLKLFFSRPPILQIANRAMMLEGSELIRQKSREFDLLFSPDVARFGLFEFDRREEIIDSGRYYAREHIADLKRVFRKS